MKNEDASMSTAVLPKQVITEPVEAARRWLAKEREGGTLLAEETLWREAYAVYDSTLSEVPEADHPGLWACVASELVFDTGQVPLNQCRAAKEACQFLVDNPGRGLREKARALEEIADRYNVDAWKLRALLGPGTVYPWMFPRALWSRDVAARSLEALFAPFAWESGREPSTEWLADQVATQPAAEFLATLRERAPDGSQLDRMLAALTSLVKRTDEEGKDVSIIEPQGFISALQHHGLSEDELSALRPDLLTLREALVLLASFQLYHRAEGFVLSADGARETDPEGALGLLARAANIYKRLCVAQMYPERLLARQQEICRSMEELRREAGLEDDRADHVLLVSTFNSPGDLQRLVLSVAHELTGFAYGKRVHVVVSDESTGTVLQENEDVLRQAKKAGMSIAHWGLERRDGFLNQLSRELFPDGTFDVSNLAGPKKPGEKGVPYGRLRNFLRLAGLVEMQELDLEEPIFTWLDQDNELGALVLTKPGTLSKRHVFNYFDQKSDIFTDPQILVGGGGYTNDALEGVEKFWVAWGILNQAFDLAQEHSPEGPAILGTEADITKFRPWDQPETLERLPREGDEVQTMSDQFLLLLNTLLGTFRGKYDNQVQVYHPWTYAYVEPEDERLVEEMRSFAGMPGGNTSFRTGILASSIPFITVGGRGEDIFHLWQVEGQNGPGTVRLTHTPALHTRNVRAGRGDLMSEIIDSYNGRIFREPPYVWAALSHLLKGGSNGSKVAAEVEAETAQTIDNLRGEAKANISAVSGFAVAMEPYLDEKNEFWWLGEAKDDPRCAEAIDSLRSTVERFKDVERYHRLADEKLLRLDDVKELTSEFISAYPHWATVVAHVGGPWYGRKQDAGAADVGRLESYGSPLREEVEPRPERARRALPEPAMLVEPADEPVWQEVITSSFLLFRRYEHGRAEEDRLLQWRERVDALRSIYRHYESRAGEMPAFVWPKLFRGALLIPHSAPYLAVNEILAREVWSLGPEEGDAEISRLAAQFEVDEDVLRQALSPGGGVPPSG